ncbi:hypothetical protein [Rheinheimera sp. UJ63]|uniref:hypothetical protein n=1 Tax=Rheinheimera sp. UJ63 TaxID=2910157 RepID=UPI001F35E704|nr:hypothetical protein [Rheinheimera sp. UJ63]MCF4010752.1 hypothetical protein [Rheinheimera sp. UJ63]
MIKPFLCSASALLLVVCPPLFADNRLETAIEQCRAQSQAQQRLACYDAIKATPTTNSTPAPKAAAVVVAPTTVTPPPAKAAAPAAAVAAVSRPAVMEKQFGNENKQVKDELEQISVTVKKISYTNRKLLIIEFDNQQIWQQTNSSFYPIQEGERHYIKRGIFGSFTLANDNNNRTLKVKRVK